MSHSGFLTMKWSDSDLLGLAEVLYTRQNSEARVVPLSSTAVANLRGSPSTADPVYPITRHALAADFARDVQKVGLANVRSHALRHSDCPRAKQASYDP